MNFDLVLFNLIRLLADKSRLLDFLGIFLADYFGYLIFFSALVIIWYSGDWKKRIHYFSFLALTLILSRGIITELIRFFYHRPRPFMVLDFTPLIDQVNQGAFPSGHAAFYFSLGGVIWFLNKNLGWRFAGAAALMGLARVFVGVHWPLDILGGAAVGIISVYIVYLLLESPKSNS